MLATWIKIHAWGSGVGTGPMQSKHVSVADIAKRASASRPYTLGSELLCATLAAAAASLALPANAQQQQVRPPIAVCWMSVETAAGMCRPGLPPGSRVEVCPRRPRHSPRSARNPPRRRREHPLPPTR